MTATLNGVRLLQIAPVTWNSTPGFEPSSTIVYVERSLLDQVRQRSRNAVLQIGSRVIENLVIRPIRSGTGASDEVIACGVELVDRRWFLSRKIITAAYNVRRRTGRLSTSGGPEPIQVAAGIAEKVYIPSTLNSGRPWTIAEVVDDLFLQAGFPFVDLPTNFPESDAFGSAGLLQTGYASDILSALFSRFAAGFRFALKDGGEGIVYDTSDIEEEREQIELVTPALRGGGFVAPMDRRYERPIEMEVQFFAESEIRFDYDEAQDQIFAASSPVTEAIDDSTVPPAWLESAAEVPIPGLDIYGFPAARGSISNLYAMLLAARESLTLPPNNSLGHITYDIIKRLYFRDWEKAANYTVVGGYSFREFGSLWRAIDNAFRLQYRVSRDWVDRIRLIQPYRVQLRDDITLARQQSPVFSDYVSIPSDRYTGTRTLADYQKVTWVQIDSVSEVTSKCIAAPAKITGLDSETKAFSVQFRRSIGGTDDDVRPALPDPLPDTFNQSNVKLSLSLGLIKGGYKMATIMSCVPYPRAGEKSHLHSVIVKPEEAAAAANIDKGRLGECLGPRLEILVPFGPITTARFAWRDDLSEALRAPFFRKNARFPGEALDNDKDIQDLARGIAAGVYASLLDTLDGRQTTPATKEAPHFAGGMSSIQTTASPGGIASTSVQFTPRGEPLNPYRFVPAELLQRLLNSGA